MTAAQIVQPVFVVWLGEFPYDVALVGKCGSVLGTTVETERRRPSFVWIALHRNCANLHSYSNGHNSSSLILVGVRVCVWLVPVAVVH